MTKSPQHSQAMLVRQALWVLQKELLSHLKEEFDREIGYAAAPTEWFQVLMTAERYAWLRELTSLMADIDILTELDFITEHHAGIARIEIESLFFEQTYSSEGFGKHYREALLRGSGLLPLHSQLKTAVHGLPKSEMTKDQSLAERKSWHEEHRHQARKKRN